MTPNADLLRRFRATDPILVAKTTIAAIWKVRFQDAPAALKLYHDGDPHDELPGFALLDAVKGHGAAHVIDYGPYGALLEWLDGPSLGDVVRAGQDAQATRILIATAQQMHQTSAKTRLDLPSLSDRFRALMEWRVPAETARPLRQNLERAQQIVAQLLATQTEVICLHADLHHDNIRHSARGYLAFDAKGVIGERGYEFANVFRNPLGMADLTCDSGRINNLADQISNQARLPRSRLLGWAVAHSALSMAWNKGHAEDQDTTLLSKLLKQYDHSLGDAVNCL